MDNTRKLLMCIVLFLSVVIAIVAATFSPLHEWRQPIYITASFAGIAGMAIMLFQPVLIAGYLPNVLPRNARRIHQWIGSLIVLSVFIHVLGLWITSPPDVVDALLFVSATPFSNWGVVAMWAVLITASLSALRHKLPITLRHWQLLHRTLAVIIIVGTVVHAMLIDGAMETFSKAFLCILLLVTTLMVMTKLRWRKR